MGAQSIDLIHGLSFPVAHHLSDVKIRAGSVKTIIKCLRWLLCFIKTVNETEEFVPLHACYLFTLRQLETLMLSPMSRSEVFVEIDLVYEIFAQVFDNEVDWDSYFERLDMEPMDFSHLYKFCELDEDCTCQ